MKSVTAWVVGIVSSAAVACAAPSIGEPLAGGSQALDNGPSKTADAGSAGDASAARPVLEGAVQSRTLICESRNDLLVSCPLELPSFVHVVSFRVSDQLSSAPCVLDKTYGASFASGTHEQDGIWVDKGCGAEFEVTYEVTSPSSEPPEPVAVYRGYNAMVGDHLQGLVDGELSPAWYPEGVGFHLYASKDAGDLVPLYSCLIESDGHHFLSSRDCEGETKLQLLGYLSPTPQEGLRALVRCYHDGRDDHLSTWNESECSSPGFVDEGVQGYVLP